MRKYAVLLLFSFLFFSTALADNVTISGEVRDDDGNFVSCEAYFDGESQGTSQNGYFSITASRDADNTHGLSLVKPGYDGPSLEVATDGNISIKAYLRKIIVTGQVLSRYRYGSAYTYPVNEAAITLTNSLGQTLSAASDPSGYYKFTAVPNGTYTLNITKEGLKSVSRTVQVSGDTSLVQDTLLPATIIVTVDDSDTRAPLSGCTVFLKNMQGDVVKSDLTNSNGIATMSYGGEGDMIIQAIPHADRAVNTQTININEGVRNEATISLTRPTTVEITVDSSAESGTGSLKAAIDSAKNSSYQAIINILDGLTISVASPLIVKNNNNQPITINGRDCTLRRKASFANGPMMAIDSPYVSIAGITFNGNSAGSQIVSVQASAARISYCQFVNPGTSGQEITVSGDKSLFFNNHFTTGVDVSGRDNLFDNNTFVVPGIGINLTNSATNCAVRDNSITVTGVSTAVVSAVDRIEISNNSISNASRGIALTNSIAMYDRIIGNNTLTACAIGIDVRDRTNIVCNNTIDGGGMGKGIVVEGNGHVIYGNTIANCLDAAIEAANTSNFGISKNTISSSNKGIKIENCQTVQVKDNTIGSASGSGSIGISYATVTSPESQDNLVTGQDTAIKWDNTTNAESRSDKTINNTTDGVNLSNTVSGKFLDLFSRRNQQDLRDNSTGGAKKIFGAYSEKTYLRNNIQDNPDYTMFDNYLGEISGQTYTLSAPDLSFARVRLNAGDLFIRMAATERCAFNYWLQAGDSDVRARSLGSVELNPNQYENARMPLRSGMGMLKSQVLVQATASDNGVGPFVSYPVTVIGAQIGFDDGITGTRYATQKAWNSYTGRINNLGSASDSFTVKLIGPDGPIDSNGSYVFKVSGQDVTSQVLSSSGYQTAAITAGGYLPIELLVKPAAGVRNLTLRLKATSDTDNVDSYVSVLTFDTTRSQIKPNRYVTPQYDRSRKIVNMSIYRDSSSSGASAQAATGEVATIIIYDLSGRVVLRQETAVVSGYNTSELNTSSLGRGSYVYQVVIGGQVIARGKIAITN
ncbi:MAG: carboxypeptidase regulatory-like domain-containing protein [Candidatus Margulisbacteria bacterium]|nr:carboxypeptidase regulatory-like domain-containing protein [Candidatus Margulisiibacteriota bacterium]